MDLLKPPETNLDEVDDFDAYCAAAYKGQGRRGSRSVPSTPKARGETFNRASFRSERAARNRNKCQINDYERELAKQLEGITIAEVLARRRLMEKMEMQEDSSPEMDNEVFSHERSPRNSSPFTRGSRGGSFRYPHSHASPQVTSKHHRSYSCKDRPRTRKIYSESSHEPFRQRTSSMPTRSRFKRPNTLSINTDYDDSDSSTSQLYRVRTFSTSAKGIINRGDSFKRRSTSSNTVSQECIYNDALRPRTSSVTSQGSSVCSTDSVCEAAAYNVLMIGSQGVGKRSIIQQFMTSEYLGQGDTQVSLEESKHAVSVLLDGEESMLHFTDIGTDKEPFDYGVVDAYVVVYSVADRDTFDEAVEVLYHLKKEETSANTPQILVANKQDMVRNRDVTEEEGKVMAVRYECKYIEVSVLLNIKVDELLAGLLKQIRLFRFHQKRKRKHRKCIPDETGCVQSARGIVGKLFRKSPYEFRSCDNLLVL